MGIRAFMGGNTPAKEECVCLWEGLARAVRIRVYAGKCRGMEEERAKYFTRKGICAFKGSGWASAGA